MSGTVRFGLGDGVYKRGQGYEGPGVIEAVFKTWMGDYRYVVSHRLAGGRGYLYHIYSAKQLEKDPLGLMAAGAVIDDSSGSGPAGPG
jgi:hypothetical protein